MLTLIGVALSCCGRCMKAVCLCGFEKEAVLTAFESVNC